MIERIYERLLKERLVNDDEVGNYMSPLHYNMMVQSAAVYKRHRLLAQLVLETTVLDVKVDTQSYIKTIISTHYQKSKSSGKDNLAYLYTLFENDVPREDYALASVLLQEYVSTVTDEHFEGKSYQRSMEKEKRKKRRSSRDKQRKSSRSRKQENEFEWSKLDMQPDGTNPPDHPPVDLHSHGEYQQQIVVTPDQFEYDELIHGGILEEGEFSKNKKRHALYKSRMAELAQYRKQLKKQGNRDESSRHIDKYRHQQKHKTAEEPV